MKLIIALFALALLTTAATSVGFALWDDHLHRDTLKPVHYDKNLHP